MASQEKIAELLLSTGAVELRPKEPFRFASGILSPIYCDNRLLLSETEGRGWIVDSLCEFVDKAKAEQVAGVATAGIAWGAWIAERLKLPFIYIRSSAKEHGKKNQIEGRVKKGAQIAVIEDLISTGGSVLNAVDEVSKAGAFVVGVFAIFSYHFKESREAFQKRKIPVHTLVNIDTLLEVAKIEKKIGQAEVDLIRLWQSDPRNWDQV